MAGPSPCCEHMFDCALARSISPAMTSPGQAYTLLRRVLQTRSSAVMIRAAAAELPSVPLEDALDICLALLELEPDTYPTDRYSLG